MRAGDRPDLLVHGLDRLLDLRGDPLQLGDQLGEALARQRPRSSASRRPSRYIAATWLTKVLVAATPISRPARVKRTASASRVAWLPMMLVTASTLAPPSRARRIAASVSAVSPDWVIPITRSFAPTDRVAVAVLGGDVHLDRDPRPLLDRVAADEAGVVGGAAGDDHDPLDVAQEVVVELDVGEVDPVVVGSRSAIVSATASGCSWISFSMKVG